MQKQFVFLLIVAILVAIFTITNAEVMTVRLFFWTYQLSGSLVILISVALGALLVIALNAISWIKQKHTIKELNKQVEQTKNELAKALQDNVTLQAEIETEKAKNISALSESITPEIEPTHDSHLW